MSTPLLRGKNSKAIFMIDGSQVVVEVVSWTVKRIGTEATDDIGGEDRSRFETITNGFSADLSCKMVDTSALESLLKDQDNDDANVEPTSKVFALSLKPNNGNSAGFAGREVTVGNWDWAGGDRTSAATLNIPLRMRYFKKLPG